VIARLKPGVRIEQALEEVRAVSGRFPGGWISATLVGLHDQIVEEARPALLVLWGAVGFVLLICCANVANLLLARAAGRRREIAIRLALGAGRLRIIRQLLIENLLLSTLGGGLGLLVGMWGIQLIVSLSPGSMLPQGRFELDLTAIGFTAALSMLTGLLFGIAPALQSSQSDMSSDLKEGAGSIGRHHRVRSLFAVSQIALALLLSIGAGLAIKSFVRLSKVDAGFNPDNVLAVDISLPGPRYPEAAHQISFYQQLIEQIEGLPGVRDAGLISDLPLSGMNADRSFAYEGMPPEGSGVPTPGADYRHTTAHYFQAMGIPIVSGQTFSDRDVRGAAQVAIVNETLARRIWPSQEAVGKRIRFFSRQGGMEDWMTVVGVVGDIKHRSLELETRNEIYVPQFQTPAGMMTLVVRADTDPLSLVGAVRDAVRALDTDLPVFNIRTMTQLYADSVARPRLSALLLGVFAGVALLLAAVGIYGVVAYSVTQRTREIGVRIALGADSSDVLKLVMRHGIRLAGAGIAIGLAASFGLTRVMEKLLYEVSATDESTFVAVTLFLVLVALLACYVPARRAAKVDPMVALRYE
jgi:putative ABC transport system permease protein